MAPTKIPQNEICHRCGNKAERRERDKKGKETGKYVCLFHWNQDYRKRLDSTDNIKKFICNCRTGNQNPMHESTKACMDQELAGELYGYEDLNKKYDNHDTPIDCQDPITGLYYQIKGKNYNPYNRLWAITNLEREWLKEYECMIIFCKSEDGNIIERIYIFPSWEITKRKGFNIRKYDSKGELYVTGLYEQYRVKDEYIMKRANEIWKRILEKYSIKKR